jgi:RNA polymerase subunit RPABC4/transcription elongation factor Spt4
MALIGLDRWALAIAWPGGSWQNSLKVLAAMIITYIIVLWVSFVIWVYRDIRDRTRDPFFQAVAVFLVLVFNFPGLWLYLILRPQQTLAEAYARSLEEEALLQDLEEQKICPNCHRRVADDFLVCPSCRTQLKEACSNCSRPLYYSWLVCPFCGTSKQDQRARRSLVEQHTAVAPRPNRRTREAEGVLQDGPQEPAAVLTDQGDLFPDGESSRPTPSRASGQSTTL